jgi:N-acetylmuramic acid 6-phosphate etherase
MSDMSTHDRAEHFLSQEKAFRLGQLLTESSHPKTRTLSQTLEKDMEAGIRMLQSVDDDIKEAMAALFAQDSFPELVAALLRALEKEQRIFFTGCGATGRLSILLEAVWREFWQRHPALRRQMPQMEERCISVMAGGDFALIKSVEGFEDYPDFGRKQLREAGVRANDVVVAITEGGETPFVIGTAWEGLDAGADVFFVYNNPTDVLREHVQRSREVMDEPRIHKLDLATGSMAITGSTRMQATTAELLVVGAALEMALTRFLHRQLNASDLADLHLETLSAEQYQQGFERLLTELGGDETVAALARATEFEETIYRKQGLITYVADWSLLDVLTDTTERSPTFMVPPFRRQGDELSPLSWGFVKHPLHKTVQTWEHMLRRVPRGLTWTQADYIGLNAPAGLQAQPPLLNNQEIHQFRIGNEADASRVSVVDTACVWIVLPDESEVFQGTAVKQQSEPFAQTVALSIGGPSPLDLSGVSQQFHCACTLPNSPLQLWRHLAVKLVLNTLSTATMARMDRVIGNAMVWLSPSNKKLIDRGCRLIAQTTGCSYERACYVLHETMADIAQPAAPGKAPPSPVAQAIGQIGLA